MRINTKTLIYKLIWSLLSIMLICLFIITVPLTVWNSMFDKICYSLIAGIFGSYNYFKLKSCL